MKKKMLNYAEEEAFTNGPIVIEDDVWIGTGVTILSGVTLHRGTVIASGAVVTRDTEPYSLYGGVPAKFIKKRFDDALIDGLMKVDFTKLTNEYIGANINALYSNSRAVLLEQIKQLSE